MLPNSSGGIVTRRGVVHDPDAKIPSL